VLFIGDWVGTESTRLESIVRVSRTEAQRRGAVVSWCDASQSVGARTLRSPTVQTTFPAVGDRVSSHDHSPAFGHSVDRSALPVVRADNYRGVISAPFVRWQFSFSSFVGNSVGHRFTYVHVFFSDYVTWVFGYVDFIAVILRSRKLFCSVNFWIYLTCRCRTFAII